MIYDTVQVKFITQCTHGSVIVTSGPEVRALDDHRSTGVGRAQQLASSVHEHKLTIRVEPQNFTITQTRSFFVRLIDRGPSLLGPMFPTVVRMMWVFASGTAKRLQLSPSAIIA